MSPELAAQLALALYATLAALAVAWQIRRSRAGWRVWLLYVIERTYVALFLHWRSNRRCPFPEEGPGLIIANHRSPTDPMILWMNHNQDWRSGRIGIIRFLMAREYYEWPGVHWICKAVGAIPVERHGRDIAPAREALRRLKEGTLLAIFPEGRINRGEGLLKADTGVAWLALRAQVPVYPVFVEGAPQGRNLVEPFLRFSRVRVIYGDPIDLSEYYDRRISRELLQEVTDLMMHRLAELGGVEYPADDADEPAETLPFGRATG